MKIRSIRISAVALALVSLAGCGVAPTDSTRQAQSVGSPYDRFAAFDASGADVYGIKGYLPPNGELANQYYGMTENQRLGLATWHLFAAERGDFFRVSQKVTWGGQNMIRVIDSRGRDDLFGRVPRSQPGLPVEARDPSLAGQHDRARSIGGRDPRRRRSVRHRDRREELRAGDHRADGVSGGGETARHEQAHAARVRRGADLHQRPLSSALSAWAPRAHAPRAPPSGHAR